MAAPVPVPAARLQQANFVTSIQPRDMVYFLCNIGDGDAQLVLLPEDQGARKAIIVDAGRTGKIPPLLASLVQAQLLPPAQPNAQAPPDGTIPLVIATHPHLDHIGGMAEILAGQRNRITEFWDPGYWHTSGTYQNMMVEVGRSTNMEYAQPTSGFRKWFGETLVTVLSPSVHLRNRFDTYGTDINNASISVHIEHPAGRVVQRNNRRELVSNPRTASLILGADAQTTSWSFVMTDFPELKASGSAAARAIRAAIGRDPLRSNVLKVSHHCSKHGVNLELVERIHSGLTLISSVGGAGRYNFPHDVAQGMVREGLHATTSSGNPHPPDYDMGIFYTSDTDDANQALGSMAVVMSANARRLWRFGDAPGADIDLAAGRRWT